MLPRGDCLGKIPYHYPGLSVKESISDFGKSLVDSYTAVLQIHFFTLPQLCILPLLSPLQPWLCSVPSQHAVCSLHVLYRLVITYVHLCMTSFFPHLVPLPSGLNIMTDNLLKLTPALTTCLLKESHHPCIVVRVHTI